MNCMKRIVPLFLAFALLFSLTACGEDSGANRGKADPIQSGAAGTATGSAGTEEKDYTAEYSRLLENYTLDVAGFAPDEVVFTVNGDGVSVEEVLYEFTNLCAYWSTQYQAAGQVLDLNEQVSEGTSAGQYLFSQALDNAAYKVLMEQKAEENGCQLTDAQKKEWEDSVAAYKQAGGEEGYIRLLAACGVREELFARINLAQALENNVKEKIVPAPTEGDLEMYIEQNDALLAKHILIYTVEKGADGKFYVTGNGQEATTPDGGTYTGTVEEINAAALAQAEDILRQIREAADPIAKFDELMHKYSRDPGLASNPDGYLFTGGQMVASFENTTRELEYNEISDVVQSEFGYHIILRLRPEVRDSYMSDYMDLQTKVWKSTAEIVPSDLFEKLDPLDIFEKFVAYQQKVNAVESEG